MGGRPGRGDGGGAAWWWAGVAVASDGYGERAAKDSTGRTQPPWGDGGPRSPCLALAYGDRRTIAPRLAGCGNAGRMRRRVQMRGGARRPRARRTACTLSARPRAPTKQMGPYPQPATSTKQVLKGLAPAGDARSSMSTLAQP